MIGVLLDGKTTDWLESMRLDSDRVMTVVSESLGRTKVVRFWLVLDLGCSARHGSSISDNLGASLGVQRLFCSMRLRVDRSRPLVRRGVLVRATDDGLSMSTASFFETTSRGCSAMSLLVTGEAYHEAIVGRIDVELAIIVFL